MQRKSFTVLWYETGELVMTVEDGVTPVSNFDWRRETGAEPDFSKQFYAFQY